MPDLNACPVCTGVLEINGVAAITALTGFADVGSLGLARPSFCPFSRWAVQAELTPWPDFNGDGVVNGLDLNIWLANVGITTGASVVQGDADSDGDVDGDDFLFWQRNAGHPMPWTGGWRGKRQRTGGSSSRADQSCFVAFGRNVFAGISPKTYCQVALLPE